MGVHFEARGGLPGGGFMGLKRGLRFRVSGFAKIGCSIVLLNQYWGRAE